MTLRPALLCAALLTTASSIYACSHPWDEYNPRLTSSTGTSGGDTTSTTTSSSSGGEPDGGQCAPGSMTRCYTGPPVTRDAGDCKDGFVLCGSDAGCQEQTLPQVENCSVVGDADCDGTADDHCAVWGFAFGSVGTGASNQVYGMAVTPAGHVFITGGMRGHLIEADDAGTSLAAGTDGIFTLELDTPGQPTAERYGGGFFSAGTAVALDGDGGALLTGALYAGQTVVFQGLPPLTPTVTNSNNEMFLARLQGQSGEWQQEYAAAPPAQAAVQGNAVAFGPGAIAYAGGAFQGTADFGVDGGADGGELVTKATGSAGVVARIDTGNGTTAWQLQVGATAAISAIAAPDGGPVVAGGSYAGAFQLGSAAFPAPGAASGIVLTVSPANGQPLLGRSYSVDAGASAPISVDTMAADPTTAEVVIAGRFSGTLDFGAAALDLAPDAGGGAGGPDAGGSCGAITSVGPADVFVARLRAGDLSCVWVTSFGNSEGLVGPSHTLDGFMLRQQGFGPQVVVDAAGATLIAANFSGTLAVDGWTVSDTAFSAIVLLKLDSMGNLAWIRRFGDSGAYATGIGVDATGDVYIAGQFSQTLALAPTVTLTWPMSAGHNGMFVARIAH